MYYNKRHPIEQLIRKPIAQEWRRIRAVFKEAHKMQEQKGGSLWTNKSHVIKESGQN